MIAKEYWDVMPMKNPHYKINVIEDLALSVMVELAKNGRPRKGILNQLDTIEIEPIPIEELSNPLVTMKMCDRMIHSKDCTTKIRNKFFTKKNALGKLLIQMDFASEFIGHGMKYVFNGDANKNRRVDDEEVTVTELNGHGDFRDEECRALLAEADVVVTNPPFSLFREFIALMMEFNKKFLVIGNTNGITHKDVFPYIKNNKLWLGCSSFNSGMYFNVPEEYEYRETYKFNKFIDGRKVMRVSSICWYTNIEHSKRHLPLDLYKRYNPTEFPKYDNYDAIECSKVYDIPMDYEEERIVTEDELINLKNKVLM